MVEILIQVSKYLFVICAIYFLYSSFRIYWHLRDNDFYDGPFVRHQKIIILSSHLLGFLILLLKADQQLDLFILCIEEILLFLAVWIIVNLFYKKTNILLWNIPLYLLSVSFIVLTRLDYGIGLRHFRMAFIGFVSMFFGIVILKKMKGLNRLGWIYIGVSFLLLFIVNDTINGAQNWLTIGEFSFQPSELVKVTYVFFLAAIFTKSISRHTLLISGFFTTGLVVLLVYQRDLGGALIFYIVYIVTLYIKTNKERYFFGGLTLGVLGAFIGYQIFGHVKVRVEAWMNPWADIDRNGYQIAQSLFAIGAGGWFGTGFTQGSPEKIPVVTTDFIFSAICEEFGNMFSIILIGLFIIIFVVIFNIAQSAVNSFNFLLLSGFGIIFAFQSFLILGGVTKFIPITGVTLPFISYGGSSLIVSCIMFGVIQGVNRKEIEKKE